MPWLFQSRHKAVLHFDENIETNEYLNECSIRLEYKLLKILLNEKNFGVVCVFWVFFAHI